MNPKDLLSAPLEIQTFFTQEMLDRMEQEKLKKEVRAEKALLIKQIVRSKALAQSTDTPATPNQFSLAHKKVYKL